MLVVLEGCDGSGKSTLATFLSKLLNAEIIHCSTHTPNTLEFFDNIVDASKNRNIIADRWCYGQFIYQEESERPLRNGAEYSRTTGDAEAYLRELEANMLDAGAKVIYVTAPNDIIKKRLAERAEKPINGLTVDEIQNRYKTVISQSLLTWIEYNTGGTENV